MLLLGHVFFQNVLPRGNNWHVCPAWQAASRVPTAAWVLRVTLGGGGRGMSQGPLGQGSMVVWKGLS